MASSKDYKNSLIAITDIENLIDTYIRIKQSSWDEELKNNIISFASEVGFTPTFVRASYRKEAKAGDGSIFVEKQISDNTYVLVRFVGENISVHLQERNAIYPNVDYCFSSPTALNLPIDSESINALLNYILDISFKKYQGYSKNFSALKKLLSSKADETN